MATAYHSVNKRPPQLKQVRRIFRELIVMTAAKQQFCLDFRRTGEALDKIIELGLGLFKVAPRELNLRCHKLNRDLPSSIFQSHIGYRDLKIP
jgi:hypothetical protein